MTITREFLESKILYNVETASPYKSGSGNIERLSDKLFSFNEYNFLPNEDLPLDGHYMFYVNVETFDFLIYRSSYYGGLTYTRPVTFEGFLNKESFNEEGFNILQSIIADKLLGSYFYDYNKTNQKGEFLFPSTEEYCNRYKQSLICDHRGYIWTETRPQTLSDIDWSALKILCNIDRYQVNDFNEEEFKIIWDKFKNTHKGKQKEALINVNNKRYLLIHKKGEVHGEITKLFENIKDNDFHEISSESLNHQVKDFIKIIPSIVRNYVR